MKKCNIYKVNLVASTARDVPSDKFKWEGLRGKYVLETRSLRTTSALASSRRKKQDLEDWLLTVTAVWFTQ